MQFMPNLYRQLFAPNLTKSYPLIYNLFRCSNINMAAQENVQVFHDKDKCEFTIELADEAAHKAFLSYSWVKQNHMDMHHTEVPPVFRGKGVAKILAKAAFDFAVEKDAKMTLSCTYLQKYFKDNPKPEYQNQIV